jgi:thiamine biosynthesis lipoprotein ApbE
LLGLTIIGRNIVECDVLATAGFALGPSALDWLADYPGVQAFGCFADGNTRATTPTGRSAARIGAVGG